MADLNTDLKCTSCAGTEVQKLSMVYESGTSVINAKTRGTSTGLGVGGGRGGIGIGIGSSVNSSRTTGTQMTETAKKAAPPDKKMAFGWIGIGLVAMLFIALAMNSWFTGILIMAGCGYMAYLGFQHNAKVYPSLRQQWEKSWMCHRCGHIFQW